MVSGMELTSEGLDGLTILFAIGFDASTRLGKEEVRQLWKILVQPAMWSIRRTQSNAGRVRDSETFGGLNSQSNFQAPHQESSVITLDERG